MLAYSGTRAHLEETVAAKPLHARSSGRIARHSAIRLHQVSYPSDILVYEQALD